MHFIVCFFVYLSFALNIELQIWVTQFEVSDNIFLASERRSLQRWHPAHSAIPQR